MAIAEDCEIPVITGTDSIQQATKRLREVKEAAVGFERKVNQVASAVARANGRSSTGKIVAECVLFSLPLRQTTMPTPTKKKYPDDGYTTHSTTHWPAPQGDALSIQDPSTMSKATVLLAATDRLRERCAAEQALQTATGNTFPPLECWGVL
jgi:hypothetical protein